MCSSYSQDIIFFCSVFFFFFFHSNQRISHMTCCDVFIWCFPACLTFTGRQTRQCSDETDIIDSGFIHRSLISATDWQAGEGAATLKQNQFSVCLVKGGRCLQIAVQKISPSFSQEKRSFHFINSRLKPNYLPVDLNHQDKDNRTKSSFFFSH